MARYEQVREDGVIACQAVVIAVAVDGEGRRQVLAAELANREAARAGAIFPGCRTASILPLCYDLCAKGVGRGRKLLS
jgi:hypothetical protein